MSENAETGADLELSPLWKDQPNLWFLKAEARFRLRRITSDEAKYNIVVRALENDDSKDFADVLGRPSETDKYENLKSEVIGRSEVLAERKFVETLEDLRSANLKPTELLREVTALLGPHRAHMRRQIWLDVLTPWVRLCVRPLEWPRLQYQAEVADTLLARSEGDLHSTDDVNVERKIVPLRPKVPQMEYNKSGPSADPLLPEYLMAIRSRQPGKTRR